MSTIFSKIIERKIPAHIVAEDENHIAFLDIYPLVLGHTLVIPTQETDYFFDLSDKAIASLMTFAKRVSITLQTIVPCKRVALLVLGLEIPHVHVHLLPIQHEKDLNLHEPRQKAQDTILHNIATQIRKAFHP